MPELPKVETIRRMIGPQIKGRIILAVEVITPTIIARPSPDEFIEKAVRSDM